MVQWSNELSYEISEDGYDIFLHGKKWVTQHEPLIPYPDKSYEENAILQCESLDEVANPVKILASRKAAKISEMKESLNTFLKQATITSNCHGGAKNYSVNSEKQQLLTAMIQRKQYADANNIPFDATWNARGEVAEKYELSELQQLNLEIYQFVQQYVLDEQERELVINGLSDVEDVDTFDITFS